MASSIYAYAVGGRKKKRSQDSRNGMKETEN